MAPFDARPWRPAVARFNPRLIGAERAPVPLPRFPFHGWSIRLKLQFAFLGLFMAMALVQGVSSRWILDKVVHRQAEKELDNATTSLENLVKTAVDTSIQSYLRGIAEKNLELVSGLHAQALQGRITEAEAQRRSAEILLGQRIGKTGYIYVVDSSGHIRVHPHPELRGADLTRHDFIREQIVRRVGYLEYQWANPGESRTRPKALYMTHFAPWDWIISVSSYRDEFRDLVNINDFRNRILEVRFGETGYPYVIDTKGVLVVHPAQQGRNILDSQDSSGRFFIKELIERKNGRIVYPWRNPGDKEARDKLVVFRHLPEMDWIVASSSYLEEFQWASRVLAWTTAGSILCLALISVICTFLISRSMTRPLGELTRLVATNSGAELPQGRDEVAMLREAFQRYLSAMEEGQKRLSDSESRHRGLFENAVEGIFQSTVEGRFLRANPSMAKLLKYDSPEQLLAMINDIPQQLYAEPSKRQELWDTLATHGEVHGFELQLLCRDGSPIWGSIHARAVMEHGQVVLMEGFLTDVSMERQARETLLQAQRELEDRVEHRTQELRGWVEQLERRNFEIAELQEMTELLAMCQTIPEGFPIMEGFLTRLFEGCEGQFYFADDTGFLKAGVRIGTSPVSMGLSPEECWGMRGSKPYHFAAHSGKPPCPHLSPEFEGESLCIPISGGGETHGLLHLRRGADSGSGDGFQVLGPQVADHLVLALINLKLRETLRNNSTHDALTGLYNRRYMDEIVVRELQRAVRQDLPVGFALFDIDHFKRFNDEYGHDMGDAVLRKLARHVSERLRGSDLVFRFGGEEFLLVLPGADGQSTWQKAEDLRESIARDLHLEHPKGRLSVTISTGVAARPDHGSSLEQLLKAADTALYVAKGSGRNRVVLAEWTFPTPDPAPGQRPGGGAGPGSGGQG